jgi:holliday junction DNA helicase RuvA
VLLRMVSHSVEAEARARLPSETQGSGGGYPPRIPQDRFFPSSDCLRSQWSRRCRGGRSLVAFGTIIAMISSLRGTIRKNEHPCVTLDVQGVGYAVQCTESFFEQAKEGEEAEVHTYTFVREDRLELFGFASANERKLFTHFLGIPGIGPRTALQLCSVPMVVLGHAVENEDTRALSNLKGIGKKMAEKLLVELTSLAEKGVLVSSGSIDSSAFPAEVDHDALEALTNLGYDRRSVLRRLKEVPGDIETTEERVKHVLQTL